MTYKGLWTRTDTTFFKGIGILMIIFHNYFHQGTNLGLENEQGFDPNNLKTFLSYFQTFNPENWIAATFAFLGHYGVQIFILFSAYGLTVQYMKKNSSTKGFVIHELKKIYFLLGFGVLFCIGLAWLSGEPYTVYQVLRKTLFLGSTVSSFLDWKIYNMFSGPFWFFALIIQFYILFPFLYKLGSAFSTRRIWLLFALIFVMIYTLNYLTLYNHFLVFGSILGHLPEAMLGIVMARSRIKNFNWKLILGALVVFIASQSFGAFFPLSFLFVSILLVSMIAWLERVSGKMSKPVVLFIGKISMILFIVNGPLRWFPIFSDFSIQQLFYYIPILFVLSYLLYLVYNSGRKAVFRTQKTSQQRNQFRG